MQQGPEQQEWDGELHRLRCAILVADVVGSVQLVRRPQARFVERWRRVLREARMQILPAHGGRLVKSLGDGMLCVFPEARSALRAAHALHRAVRAVDDGVAADDRIFLRIGGNVDEIEVDEIDVFGAGVDLSQRVAGLARPGETVATAPFRDDLTDGVDAEVEDLGECFVKHIDEPQRCFRLREPGAPLFVVEAPRPDAGVLQLAVAVMPPEVVAAGDRGDAGSEARERALQLAVVADMLADQVAGSLSRTPQLRVISRLACAALAQRALSAEEIGARLGARYLVTGTLQRAGDRFVLHAEALEAASGTLVWSGESRIALAELLGGTDPAVADVVAGLSRAILDHELQRSGQRPLPSLTSHQLLLAGIAHLHRSSSRDFERARSMLELVAERHGRLPQGHAWLANWHAMHAVQGLCPDPAAAGRRAIDHANRALDADEGSALAWVMRGLVQGFLRKDLDAADRDYAAALAANPSEPLAWLYTATLRSWQGRGAEALAPAREALRLAPVGPLRYYFESLAGLAALAAGDDAQAAEWSASSLRANRMHTSTHRTLAIALWRLGRHDEARATVAEMLSVEPGFSVARYLERFPGGATGFARENARVLVAAGAPAQ